MAETLLSDRDWAEIPYFRKSWFMVLLFLVFIPGYLVILWTGDTYYWKQGVVYRMSRNSKIKQTFIVTLLMLTLFVRHYH